MSLSTKSQVGSEVLILVGVLLFGALGLISATYIKLTEYNFLILSSRASKLLDNVVKRINAVFFEGDGFTSSLYVESTLLGEEYNISVVNNTIVIEFRGNTISKKTAAPLISGNLSKGTKNWVSNQNGTIYIT